MVEGHGQKSEPLVVSNSDMQPFAIAIQHRIINCKAMAKYLNIICHYKVQLMLLLSGFTLVQGA